jgi:hypothetical protein
MERLKQMKDSLVSIVQSQMSGHLDQVDTEELGDAIDMIKDLEEAIYYCTITKAMTEKEDKEKEHHHYYTERVYPDYMPKYYPYYRDMDRSTGRMYYDDTMYYGGNGSTSGSNSNSGMSSGSRGYDEVMTSYPSTMMRDAREGRSRRSRKSYMESKEMHQGKEMQMKELEKYMQELTHDITEMVSDASPEEKAMLQQKVSMLASKIK